VKLSKSYVFGSINASARMLAAGLVGVGVLTAAATDARAAVITGIGVTVTNNATGSLGPVGGVPIAPNNDNTGGLSPNVVPSNHFLFNTLPLDFEFKLENSGGTTEYRFTPSFFNISPQTWTNFQFELGFGTGAGFVRSGAPDGLDFDTPDGDPSAFSPFFPVVDHQADTLAFRDGSIGFIKPAAFLFAIDVPDNLKAFNPYDMSRFTLRITPNGAPAPTPVPEPGTMMLLGTGIAALAARNRKRRT
jgi:hypothetical protein